METEAGRLGRWVEPQRPTPLAESQRVGGAGGDRRRRLGRGDGGQFDGACEVAAWPCWGQCLLACGPRETAGLRVKSEDL